MATTGIVNGTLFILYVSTDSGSSYNAVGSSTSASLSLSMDTRETTNKGDAGWRTLLESTKSWTAEAEQFFIMDATLGPDELADIITNRTLCKIKFSTETAGDTYWHGDAYLTSLSVDAPLEDSSTISLSFEGTGVLTKATN
tara:strand:+ start:252 stop:677 length:426 start_codon:yes stop_codon:yes gene_type:complete